MAETRVTSRPCPRCSYPLDAHVVLTLTGDEEQYREYCHMCGYGRKRNLSRKKKSDR